MKQHLLTLAVLAIAGTAGAQTTGTPLGKFTLGTAGLSTAFGMSGNTVALAFSGSYGPPRPPDNTRFDASTAVSLGLGNPVSGLGVELDVNLTSFRHFGASGNVSGNVSKMFQINDKGVYSVMLAVGNLGAWGDAAKLPDNASVLGSYLFGIGAHPAVVTVGATNALNPRSDIEALGSFGYSLNADWALSVGFAGKTPVLGATWQPEFLHGVPVSISVSHVDDENRRKLSIDFSRSFNLMGK